MLEAAAMQLTGDTGKFISCSGDEQNEKMKAAKLIQLLIIFPFRRYKRMELTEEYR